MTLLSKTSVGLVTSLAEQHHKSNIMTEEIRKQIIEELKEYLKENIEDFELKAQLAWDKMDKWRAPLYHVDPSFNDEITDKVEEWFNDNFDNEDLI